MPGNKLVALRTSDGLDLSARPWPYRGKARKKPLIILAPGFAQHHSTPIMRRTSEVLADYGEVLCLNFRGTGGNLGRYCFGAEEHLDVEAALSWAKRRNPTVYLIGFSMGGYISLRAAAENPGAVSKLFLVSAPTRVEDIVLTLGPIRQALFFLTHPAAMRLRRWAGSNIFFRWGWPFKSKPRGQDLAAMLKAPVALLAGSSDQLVLPILSRRIFDAAKGQKRWTEFGKGHHAEHMVVLQEQEFRDWFTGRGLKRD